MEIFRHGIVFISAVNIIFLLGISSFKKRKFLLFLTYIFCYNWGINFVMFQKDTAIYNIASGTCLGALSPEVDSYVVMKLCGSTENVKWNLVLDSVKS